jgi:hypothetical protein
VGFILNSGSGLRPAGFEFGDLVAERSGGLIIFFFEGGFQEVAGARQLGLSVGGTGERSSALVF